MNDESVPERRSKYISVKKAGEELGVQRTSMYYYIQQLGIETKKFPLDRKAYIAVEDLKRIQAAKTAAETGEH